MKLLAYQIDPHSPKENKPLQWYAITVLTMPTAQKEVIKEGSTMPYKPIAENIKYIPSKFKTKPRTRSMLLPNPGK